MDLEAIYKDMMAERACRIETEGTIIGTCEEFCPQFEYIERLLRKDVGKYEQEIMFKKYYRSSAGKSKSFPEDVRPINVLLQATNYLIDLSFNDFSLDIYKFIENRTRAIRLDLSVQSLSCTTTINILEKITRFYILYYYALFDNKEFEGHLNQEQIKKILSTLDFLYQKNKIVNEEFISYSVLISMDNKFPQNEQYLNIPKVKQVYNIRKYYQQGDFYNFFKQCKQLDLLSFIVALMSFDNTRMKAIEIYSKSLVEKIDLSFFNELLYTTDTEIQSIFDKMNVDVYQGKADFKSTDIYEKDNIIIKERKEQICLKYPSILIYLGDIEYKIGQFIFSNYICEFILKNYNKTVDKRKIIKIKSSYSTISNNQLEESVCYVLLNKLSECYTTVIMENIDRVIKEKEIKKQIVKKICFTILNYFLVEQTLKYTQIYSQKLNLKKIVLQWTNLCRDNQPSDTPKEQLKTLAIVLNDSIYSVLFRNTVEKSKLNEFKPVFYNIKNILPQKLLKFNLSIFSVDKNLMKEINEKYFMLNKIVDTPQNLIKSLDKIEERLLESKRIVRSKLFALLKGKNKNKQMFIVTQLIEKERNTHELENILIKIGNNEHFKDIDVYFEEGENF